MKTLTLLLYVIYVRVNTNMALLSAIFKYGDEVGNLFIEVYHHFIEEKKIVLKGISCCTVTICLDQGNNLPQPSSITFSKKYRSKIGTFIDSNKMCYYNQIYIKEIYKRIITYL